MRGCFFMNKLHQSRGVTLIELLVTTAIALILLAIGAPSYQSLITSMRMSGEINNLTYSLNLARSEAIKRGQTTTICSVSNPTAVPPTCSTNSWASGWIVYEGTTANLLRVSTGLSSGDKLIWTGASNPTASPNGYFSPSGTFELNDSTNDVSQKQCVTIATGSLTPNSGANCP